MCMCTCTHMQHTQYSHSPHISTNSSACTHVHRQHTCTHIKHLVHYTHTCKLTLEHTCTRECTCILANPNTLVPYTGTPPHATHTCILILACTHVCTNICCIFVCTHTHMQSHKCVHIWNSHTIATYLQHTHDTHMHVYTCSTHTCAHACAVEICNIAHTCTLVTNSIYTQHTCTNSYCHAYMHLYSHHSPTQHITEASLHMHKLIHMCRHYSHTCNTHMHVFTAHSHALKHTHTRTWPGERLLLSYLSLSLSSLPPFCS